VPAAPSGLPQTLVAYRLECRRLLHDSQAKFWSDAELNDYINAGRFEVAAVTGCNRKLVVGALSVGLEQYPIGGVVGGVVTASGARYTFMNVTVVGDGVGALAHATLLPSSAPTVGGTILAVHVTGGAIPYTSPPALAFAGDGSGAAATCYLSVQSTGGLPPTAAGTSYKAGDLLTAAGGTFIVPATFRVASVTAGAINTVIIENPGQYSALPADAVVLTGGSGTGATISLAGNWGAGPAVVTNPGLGYTFCTVTVSGGGGIGGVAAAVIGPITGGNGLATIVIDNPGSGYNTATFQLTGDGAGAAATAAVIPYSTLDIMNITPIFGAQRIAMNYCPYTEFNAKYRALTLNPGLPRVWSRYGTSGGAGFVQPIPDQPYPCEFDTAILPATLVADTDVDVLQYPYTQPVAYYACSKAKGKQSAWNEVDKFLAEYKQKVLTAQAVVQMRRIPNPLAGYSGG
jgi:hypothetical protein